MSCLKCKGIQQVIGDKLVCTKCGRTEPRTDATIIKSRRELLEEIERLKKRIAELEIK